MSHSFKNNKIKGQSNSKGKLLKGKSNQQSQQKAFPENIAFTFHELDIRQNNQESFQSWKLLNKTNTCSNVNNCLLLELLEKIKEISKLKVDDACSKKIINVYGDFPPSEKTLFSHPKHVTEDAKWATIHLKGKEVIAGHLINNIFSVVFLDKDHKFWISEKKHT